MTFIVLGYATVILSAILRRMLREGDFDFSGRGASIERLFSWEVGGWEVRSGSRVRKRERGIWQRRFWEHVVRDEADYRAHGGYVHFNPVRLEFVSYPGIGLGRRFGGRWGGRDYTAEWVGSRYRYMPLANRPTRQLSLKEKVLEGRT